MPFCPKCRYEYKEGVLVCPDCDLTLVAELHEENIETRPDEEPWGDIGSTGDETELRLVMGWLETAGIPVTTRTREMGLPDVYASPYGAVKSTIISVPASRLAEAKRILKNARNG